MKIQLDLSKQITINGKPEIVDYKKSELVDGEVPSPPVPIYLTLRDVIVGAIANLSPETLKSMTAVERVQLGYFQQRISVVKDKISLPTETVAKIKDYVFNLSWRPDIAYALTLMFDEYLGITEDFNGLGLEEVTDEVTEPATPTETATSEPTNETAN